VGGVGRKEDESPDLLRGWSSVLHHTIVLYFRGSAQSSSRSLHAPVHVHSAHAIAN
jgi:hypothetical protein